LDIRETILIGRPLNVIKDDSGTAGRSLPQHVEGGVDIGDEVIARESGKRDGNAGENGATEAVDEIGRKIVGSVGAVGIKKLDVNGTVI
jgi:hypothetical protein